MERNVLLVLARNMARKIRKEYKTSIGMEIRFITNSRWKWIKEKNWLYGRKYFEIIEKDKSVSFVLKESKNQEKGGAEIFFIDDLVKMDRIPGERPVLIITFGKRLYRERVDKYLRRLGFRRTWITQSYIREHLDELINRKGQHIEITSLNYELRLYKGSVFILGGKANFYPGGIDSIKRLWNEYLYPLRKTGFYVFIKSIRFRLFAEDEWQGMYGLNRWGKLVIEGKSQISDIISMWVEVAGEAIRNYIETNMVYKIDYKQVQGKYYVYSLKEATVLKYEAEDSIAGKPFLDAVKKIISKPRIDKNLIILPLEQGNPRASARIIHKNNGTAVTLTATYKGFTITPAVGTVSVDASTIDDILSLFKGLYKE